MEQLSITHTLKEVHQYRGLVWALVQRHLAQRYRGSALGFLWSIINPLCLMLVYVLVFHYYMRSNLVDNYPIFLFCGLLPWVWTSSALMEGATSIVHSGHLITKSMFPAQLLPVVAVITTMVNFVLSLPVLAVFMIVAGVPFYLSLLALPLLLVLQFVFLVGCGLLLSSLNVIFRDVQHILGNLLSFLFFLCPIVYPATVVPEKLRFTLYLNPVALLTQCYQKAILDGVFPSPSDVVYLLAFSCVVALVGNFVFHRHRESFAELL